MEKLTNQTAIVTGSGSGIGRAIAERLAAEGVNVVLTSRRQSLLYEIAEQINAKGQGKAIALPCDVQDKKEINQVVEEAIQIFGAVHILVNNSGIGVNDLVEECSEENWDLVMNTNVKGTFLFSQAVLQNMQSNKYGYILNVASQAAKNGYERAAPYCASKFAVLGFGLALQEEVRKHGIHVHSICPGLVQVPAPYLTGGSVDEGRIQVEDMAEWVLFLLKQPRRLKIENIGLFGF